MRTLIRPEMGVGVAVRMCQGSLGLLEEAAGQVLCVFLFEIS